MRALDLFCGAGGAAMGLHRAGFEVVGVDIRPQPNYPFEFHQGDAMTWPLEGFDFIWASPPCQAYTLMANRWRGGSDVADGHPDLIGPVRDRLRASDIPWVIENVMGAPLCHPLKLHGGMFGLGVYRPRLFESSLLLFASPARKPSEQVGVYGKRPDTRTLWRRRDGSVALRAANSIEEASKAMEIDWMEWDEIVESIPPAYSEFIGRQIMRALRAKAEGE